jgi:colanic acid biosynthesis glycosyl transferase WcaI
LPFNIVILSCVFPPEPVVSAQTSDQITRGLSSCGYTVTVLASFPSRPGGKIHPGFRRGLYTRQRQPGGNEIIRCFSVPSSSSTLVSRLLENIVFGLSSAALLAVLPRPDAIYSNSWPVFASGMMALAAGLRRIPYVVSVQDIYPESFSLQRRGSPHGLACRIMRWIDRQVAIHARHVIVISEAFANIYAGDRGVPRERISIVPNWVDAKEQISRPEEAAALRQRFAIPADGCLAVYGGNIGVAAGVETFVRAFQYTGSIIFGLIAGDGSQISVCQRLAAETAPRQISFFSPWPAEQTMLLYQAADVLVLPTQGKQSTASVPSKMIRYMLSGRPIIAAGLPGSELANVIEQSGCGWLVEPDNPGTLAECLNLVCAAGPSERLKRGAAGKAFALEHFTSTTCLPKVIEIIEKAAT